MDARTLRAMKRSATIASLLFLAGAAPSYAAIGPFTVTRQGMPHLFGSATGAGVSVVVGEYGDIWTSADGASWTARANPVSGSRLNGVAYAAGRFVAVGRTEAGTGLALVSMEGTTWQQAATPASGELFAVAHGGGRYLAVGPGGLVLRSSDGETWSGVGIPAGPSLTAVSYGAGLFVAAGASRRLLTSPDGVAWTDRTSSVPFVFSAFRAVTWTGSRFVAVGVGGILSSPDAASWIRVHTIGQDAVATNGAIVVAARPSGFSTSPSGDVWTSQPSAPTPGVAPGAFALSFGGGRFVAAGSNGALRISSDGVSWTDVTLPGSRLLASVAHGNARFCAVGWDGGASVSADGLSWVNGPASTLYRAHEVIWTGIRFVAVGQGAAGFSAIATSPDCIAWTSSSVSLPPGAFSVYFDAVASSGGRLVTAGAQVDAGIVARPVLATSVDGGASWVIVPSGVDSAEGALWGVAHGGGRWVAAGSNYQPGTEALATTSTDGLTWTALVAAGFEANQVVDSVVHTPDGFVASGSGIWTSADGLAWTRRLTSSDFYISARYSAGRYVAVGWGEPTGGVVATSADGNAWTVVERPRRRAWGLAFADGALQVDRVVVTGESFALAASGGLPRVSIAASVAREADLHATSTLSLSSPGAVPVTVTYATADGTAAAGADYEATAGVVTIPSGTPSGTVDVPLLTDGILEGDEGFSLRLSQVSGAVLDTTESSVTIVDTPTIAADDSAVPEGDAGPSPSGLTVRLSHSSGQAVTVGYATGRGTATPGVDYTASSGTLTFPAGISVLPVPVSVLGDTAVEPDETFTVSLSSATNGSLVDATADAVIQDDDAPSLAQRELAHGMLVREDFAAPAGVDTYRIAQAPRASYEVVVDGIAGDAGPVVLERLAADNATVLDVGAPVGTGTGVSLRFSNGAAASVVNQHLRLRGACGPACDAGDVYRVRAYETTLRSPRFSNVGGQVTLLVLQNPAAAAFEGVAYFWAADGTLLLSHPLALAARQTLVVNASSLSALVGRSGSVTVAHTAPFGVLAGKTVALEPATGFGFDTPLAARPR